MASGTQHRWQRQYHHQRPLRLRLCRALHRRRRRMLAARPWPLLRRLQLLLVMPLLRHW